MDISRIAVLAIVLASLCGCNLEDGWLKVGERDDSRLTLGITDAPVDEAAEVVILITGVNLQKSDGSWERLEISSPAPLDLLETQGSREILLSSVSVDAGSYRFVQIVVDEAESYVTDTAGGRFPLFLDDEDVLFGVSGNFRVPDDDTLDLTIDIDLRRSLVRSASSFLMRPEMRLVETERSGTIRGSVDNRLVTSATCRNGANNDIGNAVYVFSGRGATLDDIGGQNEPVTTAQVRLGTNGYSYRAAYLPAGSYTVAFTCRASEDDPLADDTVESATFARPVEVTVTSGSTTTANLAP